MPEILALQEMSGEQSELDVQDTSSLSVGYCDEQSTYSFLIC